MTIRRTLRLRIAVLVVRAVNWASPRLGRGSGTVAGGSVGLRIAPRLLEALAVRRTVILVSGTNGKTTTTALIAAGWGEDLATNDTGANMPAGQVAALVRSSSGRAVLESDEGWLGTSVEATQPAVIVALNLSRDQLDRASEVRQLAERWRTVFVSDRAKNSVIVANALDPLVVFAADGAPNVRWCAPPTSWTADSQSCPQCTNPLRRSAERWWCECGLAQPASTSYFDGDDAIIGDVRIPLELALPGSFNRGNALVALTALGEVGVDVTAASKRLATVRVVAGRYDVRCVYGRPVRLLLAKNPAGFSALLESIESDNDIWIAINARVADGHDPSWLYDVPFEILRGRRVRCLGDRRFDLATRLWYAGVEFDVDESLVPKSDRVIDVLANYTAFSDLLAESQPC